MGKKVTTVPARFCVPVWSGNYLHRNRLILELTNDFEGKKHSIILAGPGWGKTVLMTELAKSSDRPVAWITLEEEDRDAITFVTSFINSIRCCLPYFGKRILRRLPNFPIAESFRIISEELSRVDGKGLFICLDDFHVVNTCSLIEEGMEYILSYAPSRVALAICSRIEPAINLARLKVEQKVQILREADLAFNSKETFDYLAQYGISQTPTMQHWLDSYVQGWPACLSLVAQSQIRNKDAEIIDKFIDKESIYEYMSRELLEHLPEGLRNFAVAASLLNEIDPVIIAAITRNDECVALLHSLEQRHVPLSHVTNPLVYSFHPLFHAFLRSQADNVLGQKEQRDIHNKAADFFVKKGDVIKATHHYIAAGEPVQAKQTLTLSVRRLLHQQRFLTIAELLDQIPDQAVESSPTLCLARGKIYQNQGNYVSANLWYQKAVDQAEEVQEHCLALAHMGSLYRHQGKYDTAISLLTDSLSAIHQEERGWVLADLAAIHMALGHSQLAEKITKEMVEVARESENQKLESLARHRLGYIQFLHLGQPGQALENLETSISLGRKIDSEYLSLAVALLALFRFLQGDKTAGRTAAEAVNLADEWGLSQNLGFALQVLGWILLEQGKLNDSESMLRKGITICETLGDYWFLIPGYSGLACVLERFDRIKEALGAYQHLEEAVKHVGNPFFNTWNLILRAGFYIRQQDFEAAGILINEALLSSEECAAPFLNIAARIRYAQLQISQGRITSAKDNIFRALSLANECGYTWFLGIESWELGKLLERITASRPRLKEDVGLYCSNLRPPVRNLIIRTLGAFDVLSGGIKTSEKEWRRPGVKRLFKFILINRNRLLVREQIAESLWPHLSAKAADNNLRVNLSIVKEVLREYTPLLPGARLNISRECIRFQLGKDDSLDVDEFTHCLDKAGLTKSLSQKISLLQEATRIFQGPFLPEDIYEEWSTAERERLDRFHQETLSKLGCCYEEQGNNSQALSVWSQLFDLDPCNEDAISGLLKCYGLTGKHAEAVRAYQHHVDAMSELDASPDPKIQNSFKSLFTKQKHKL